MGCNHSVSTSVIQNEVDLEHGYIYPGLNMKIPKNKSEIKKYIPQIDHAYVIKVYDGDTITIAYHLNNDKSKCYKQSVRLRNIDCPEIRSKNKNEKVLAIRAKLIVSGLCLSKIVYLENLNYDKYGRFLADIIVKDESILNKITDENKEKMERFIMYKLSITKRLNIIEQTSYIRNAGINISEFLLHNDYAVEYDGGTKTKKW
jgi:hypothetical protein